MSAIAKRMASIALASAMITGFPGCAGRESMDKHIGTEQTETVDIQQTELIENDDQNSETDLSDDEEAVNPDTPNEAPEPVEWGGETVQYGEITAAAPAPEDDWQMFEDRTDNEQVSFVDVSSDEWTMGDYWNAPQAQFRVSHDYTTAWEMMGALQAAADENGEHYQIEEMDLGQYHFLFYNPQDGDPQLVTEKGDGSLLVIIPSRTLDLEDEGFLKIIASILQ